MRTIHGMHRLGIVAQVRSRLSTHGRTIPAPALPIQVAQDPGAKSADQPDDGLIEALSRSTVYLEYVDAFSETTGLTVSLRPVESWQLPLRGKRHESPFCALMAEKSRVCACCLQMQQRLAQGAVSEPITLVCSAGSCEMAVPVLVGSRLIGLLQTGQLFRHKRTSGQFERTATMLTKLGMGVDRGRMKDAFFATRVMPQKQQGAAVALLKIFAQHLSMLTNQVIMQHENAEPPAITKAKAYMQEHQAENVRLEQVAQAVNASRFYLCKLFKKATGINYTDYLARIRIEKAKNLLLNPNLRISEIAFAVGFRSLTHFNRIFSRLLAQSPTTYRSHLLPLWRT
jgi:AraC-like DNA-binding protein/ligand-binding sensor protein